MAVVYRHSDEVYNAAMEQNTFHFSAATTPEELQELNQILRESKGFNDFRRKVRQKSYDTDRETLMIEYRTAMSIAHSASTYYRLINETDLFPNWEYHTIGGTCQCPGHTSLEGVILPANDPRWKKIWPPNGRGCYCEITPHMQHEAKGVDFEQMRQRVDAFFETEEWKNIVKDGWGVNRAKVTLKYKSSEANIVICSSCGGRTIVGHNYCCECGKAINANDKGERVIDSLLVTNCSRCHQLTTKNGKYCSKCGKEKVSNSGCAGVLLISMLFVIVISFII
jgi:hypothetical protein